MIFLRVQSKTYRNNKYDYTIIRRGPIYVGTAERLKIIIEQSTFYKIKLKKKSFTIIVIIVITVKNTNCLTLLTSLRIGFFDRPPP